MERQARRPPEADVVVEGDRAVVAEPGGVVGAQRGGRVRAEMPVVMAVAVHGGAGRPDQAVALLGDPARRGIGLVPRVQPDLVARLRELVEDPAEARLRDVVRDVVGRPPAVVERRRGEEPGRREPAARLALHEPVEHPELAGVGAAQQRGEVVGRADRQRPGGAPEPSRVAREGPHGRVAVRMVDVMREPDREPRAVRPAVRPVDPEQAVQPPARPLDDPVDERAVGVGPGRGAARVPDPAVLVATLPPDRAVRLVPQQRADDADDVDRQHGVRDRRRPRADGRDRR